MRRKLRNLRKTLRNSARIAGSVNCPFLSAYEYLDPTGDTIEVTYYNAPESQQWRAHYENLPQTLEAEGIEPAIPWLYNFKLDFRFR